MPESPDYVVTDRGPYAPVRDESAYQAAVDSVADRHFRHCSPEFAEWFAESAVEMYGLHMFAKLVVDLTGEWPKVQASKGIADALRDDWFTFVRDAKDYDSWPLARQMYREVRRES